MPGPRLTVDVIIAQGKNIALIRRKNKPYRGRWALPGGFVEYGETVERAARREAHEETGLVVQLKHVVGIYSNPKRDPRCHTVSTCYAADKTGGKIKAGTDAMDARWFGAGSIKNLKLAFDHARIIRDYQRKVMI